MTVAETILEVGGAGYSLALIGRMEEGAWRFALETGVKGPRGMRSEHLHQLRSPLVSAESLSLDWDAALAELDSRQWASLYPLQVHPLFGGRVYRAIAARVDPEDHGEVLRHWKRLCGARASYVELAAHWLRRAHRAEMRWSDAEAKTGAYVSARPAMTEWLERGVVKSVRVGDEDLSDATTGSADVSGGSVKPDLFVLIGADPEFEARIHRSAKIVAIVPEGPDETNDPLEGVERVELGGDVAESLAEIDRILRLAGMPRRIHRRA